MKLAFNTPVPKIREITGEPAPLGDEIHLSSAPSDPARILIVDDSRTARHLLSRYLESRGYLTFGVDSGEAALEAIGESQFDLVILDVVLVEMDGYQVLRQLRATEAGGNLPVLMVSAGTGLMREAPWDEQRVSAQFKEMTHAIKAGADAYIPKPCNRNLLIAWVETLLERRQLQQLKEAHLARVKAHNQAVRLELEKARRIQRSFLPARLPEIEGFELASFLRPAREVAGDFYDVFSLPAGRHGLVIADVCDKGMGSSLMMALIRSLIRLLSGQAVLDGVPLPHDELVQVEPTRAVQLANDYIDQNHSDLGMFATLFFGVLDPATGRLEYVNAGHDPLFIIGGDGKIRQSLDATSVPVGALPEAQYDVHEAQLGSGETLFGYTDGVTEAHVPGGPLFSQARLIDLLQEPASSVETLIERITSNVRTHIGDSDPNDDITLLALRRMPAS